MTRNKIAFFWVFLWPALWYVLIVYLFPSPPEAIGPALKASDAICLGIFGVFTATLTGFSGDLAADVEQKRYRKFRSLQISWVDSIWLSTCVWFVWLFAFGRMAYRGILYHPWCILDSDSAC
ncbi:MAG: hypothetical protein GWO20_00475 [Candidatus Korarchaeota archaeon]|nr:hypothetical protein [Candidatus Korarchaeota archaeon]NIU82053.1 hypothetical protein [Candidatus Thorarchaeota archaeon]NIW12471.1 hypothetical protein [Candidatus Thorarchaeota archaeon]NIW50686.1 hypothetical protein [Candidatus Korarchaeota archaeon]